MHCIQNVRGFSNFFKGTSSGTLYMLKEQIQALYFMMQISFMVIVFSSFKMIILNQRVFRAGK
jgi:virulence-associated protein VapD